MKTVLLIGATGQLGSDIVTKFTAHLGQLVIYDGPRLEDPHGVREYLDGQEFDAVINCAAFHKVDECERDATRAFAVNAFSVQAMAEVCRRRDAGFLTFSTDYVFNGCALNSYFADDDPTPLNVYGASKALGEQLAYPGTVFRVASLFGVKGASGKGSNFVETMIRKAKAGEPLAVVSDIIMSPTSTADVADRVIDWLIDPTDMPPIVHAVNAGPPVSWYGFAREILDRIGLPDYAIKPTHQDRAWGQVRRPAMSALEPTPRLQMRPWLAALDAYLIAKGHLA